jgi:di/tricarboxylate transporter
MVLLLTIIVAVCTEVTSNTATISLLLPILGDLVIIHAKQK